MKDIQDIERRLKQIVLKHVLCCSHSIHIPVSMEKDRAVREILEFIRHQVVTEDSLQVMVGPDYIPGKRVVGSFYFIPVEFIEHLLEELKKFILEVQNETLHSGQV